MSARAPWDATLIAVLSLAAAGGAWWWHDRALQHDAVRVSEESSQQVKEKFPMPEGIQAEASASQTILGAVVQANPFAPDRRPSKLPDAEDDEPAPPPPPPKATFIYKGRVSMGSGQRAVLEDATTKKTHFLQVGQEVAGVKVLDIEETRVILSDLKSNEEIIVQLSQTKPR